MESKALLLAVARQRRAGAAAARVAARLGATEASVLALRSRGVWLLPVVRTFTASGKAALTRSQGVALAQAITGQARTGEALVQRRLADSAPCPHCSDRDSIFHRAWVCPLGDRARAAAAAPELIARARRAGETDPLFARCLYP